MRPPGRFRGQPVSAGKTAGLLYLPQTGHASGHVTPGEVREAFAAHVADRLALAAELTERGRPTEAEIVTIAATMAGDPTLVEPAVAAVAAGEDAATAVTQVTETHARLLAALPDPDLAARADDIRQIATAVLARLGGGGAPPPAEEPFILAARDIDPADLIRFAEAGLAGAVSVVGGPNSHTAIIARGLGVPMIVGVDPEVLHLAPGRPVLLDTAAGYLTVDPSPDELATAGPSAGAAVAHHAGGAITTVDGVRVTVLCNAASAPETRLGLAAGATGVGLLRTEILFLHTPGWPGESAHYERLAPVLGLLAGKPAVVRLLDFSGDKVPAFLVGQETGLAALLSAPGALRDQLRAIVAAGRDTRLSVMAPMVRTVAEMETVRDTLAEVASEAGVPVPPLGMMVEVATTAMAAAEFARIAGFFSIGTNDLTSEVLGIARDDPRMRPDRAADPRVLTLIADVARAAADAGISVSVCGDAAADPSVLPLLIGLGVRTLSVGAARVAEVTDQVRRTHADRCAELAQRALLAVGADSPPAPAPASRAAAARTRKAAPGTHRIPPEAPAAAS
ncbi:MAG TPA: putative PEP-binding protein [Streptosporangiaceae bacterium]|nr:putative PEP-binding protein [Streptosporangiaceae bacterium]